jgi:hypothetical protein
MPGLQRARTQGKRLGRPHVSRWSVSRASQDCRLMSRPSGLGCPGQRSNAGGGSCRSDRTNLGRDLDLPEPKKHED